MKKENRRKSIKIVILILSVLLATLLFAKLINNKEAYKDSLRLAEEWTVDIAGERYDHVNLDAFTIPPYERGDPLSISTIMPSCSFQAPVITLTLYRAAFGVYLDDVLIYSHGMDEVKRGKMTGTGINWIQLPSDVSGKELRIDMIFNEYNIQTNFTAPYVSESSSAIESFISENLSYICIGAFLVVFGICLIIASIFINVLENDSKMLVYTAFFSILTGLWLLGNKGILNLVSDNRILNVWLEYISLYMAPLPILLYMMNLREKENGKLLVLPLKILFYTIIIVLSVTLILHLTDILHFTNVLTVFHIIDFAAIFYVVASSIYLQIRHKKSEENILLAGIFMLTLCVGIDLILFGLGKYVNPLFGKVVGISAWGSLFFVVGMLLNFGLSMYRNVSYKVEQATLMNLAFTDPLTKLANREKLFRTISEYLAEKTDWGIINFDLNHLKQNNDAYGHKTGDEMLKDFSGILRDSFNDAAVVARVGGDEFYVLYRMPAPGQIEDALDMFVQNIELFNSKGKIYILSAAYGTAYSTENPHGTQDDVIMLSDKRMYEMKQKMH